MTHAIAADFTITRDPAGPPLVGFGAQMNPYLYCTPNEISEQSAKEFERKVIALAPQHVRIFFHHNWLLDKDDPISKDDRRIGESFIRTCRLAEKAGATINLTDWYGPWKDPERQMEEFAEIVDRLLNKEELAAIKYITIQNEPNDYEDKLNQDKYVQIYTAVDAALRRRGLRERVKIVSGDLVFTNQARWIHMLGSRLSKISDGYSIHTYWDYWDTAWFHRRLSETREAWDALPADQRRPLFITEFGVRGHRPEKKIEPGTFGDGKPIADTPLQASQLAWFTLEALDRGFVAMVVWTMEDAWYDRLMPYGLIGQAKDNWPLKPSYYLVRLFTHTCKPGWRAMKIEGQKASVSVAAVRGDNDGAGKHFTAYALNQSFQPITVTLAGLPDGGAPLRAIGWNADGSGKLDRGAMPKIGPAGQVRVTLSARALVALTTEPFEP